MKFAYAKRFFIVSEDHHAKSQQGSSHLQIKEKVAGATTSDDIQASRAVRKIMCVIFCYDSPSKLSHMHNRKSMLETGMMNVLEREN